VERKQLNGIDLKSWGAFNLAIAGARMKAELLGECRQDGNAVVDAGEQSEEIRRNPGG
jgi:hypothetical protein